VRIPPAGSDYSGMIFVRPLYDINESGIFLAALAKALDFNLRQILVIVDDLTIDRNKIILSVGKPDGRGDAHNGIKSINQALGSGEYARLRIGVSNPKTEGQEVNRRDWVLGPIPQEDQDRLLTGERAKALLQLIQNQRQRLNPEAHQQRLAAESAQILKELNKD
jgi:peptidyl-tRNA hydrolase